MSKYHHQGWCRNCIMVTAASTCSSANSWLSDGSMHGFLVVGASIVEGGGETGELLSTLVKLALRLRVLHKLKRVWSIDSSGYMHEKMPTGALYGF